MREEGAGSVAPAAAVAEAFFVVEERRKSQRAGLAARMVEAAF
jgi:hypothetical protein